MHRYTTKHDDDLRLGASQSASRDDCSCDIPLRQWLAVLDERLRQVVNSVAELASRMDLLAKQNAEIPVRLGVTDTRMNAIDCRFDAVENRLCGVEGRLVGVDGRLGVVEERLSHTATKTWVLGCAVALLLATLSGTLGGVWWIVQQYIGPLLRASAG
jgi:hypothetical protein